MKPNAITPPEDAEEDHPQRSVEPRAYQNRLHEIVDAADDDRTPA